MHMPAWLPPLLYYAASMLYIYMTYALSQSQTPPLWFGADAAERSVRLWLYTNSLVAGGFLLFAVHRGGVGVFSWARKHLLLVTAAGVLAIFSSMGTTASLPALGLLMLTAGYFAGGAHYVSAMTIPAPYRGRFLGGAITLTVLIQYLLSSGGKDVSGYLLMLVLLCLSFLAFRSFTALDARLHAAANDQSSVDERNVPPSPRFIAMLIVMVSCLAALHGCGDIMALKHYAQFDESLFHDTARLFFPAGIIAAGCVADYAQRKYLLSVTALALLLRIISLLTTNTQDMFFLAQSTEYFIDSFCIMSYTLYFMDIAPLSDKPSLWAGMGRTLALPISALSANVFALILDNFSLPGFMAAYVLILALLNLFFYHAAFREWLEIPAYERNAAEVPAPVIPVEPTGAPIPAAAIPLPETVTASGDSLAAVTHDLAYYQQKFDFTRRELDVLTGILEAKTAITIAEELGIKERTVRFHISNILKKTGLTHSAELKLFLPLCKK